ncbi:MAG: glutamine amidotransferase [Chloroflexi bacterium]|nr:glutamine amidotransferase [Chloroflexota bacterium]
MKNAYVYVLDTLADWELGYVMAELNSGRFFKNQGERIPVKIIGATNAPITTMGGMQVAPTATMAEVTDATSAVLLLPGADTWQEPQHRPIIEKAAELLESGATVAAICGATSALAQVGLLDKRPHTSNGLDYLKMVCPRYQGAAFYQAEKAVADGNLITASSAGGLLFARYVLARLGVFSSEMLEAWYQYYHTGEGKYFHTMMQTLEK